MLPRDNSKSKFEEGSPDPSASSPEYQPLRSWPIMNTQAFSQAQDAQMVIQDQESDESNNGSLFAKSNLRVLDPPRNLVSRSDDDLGTHYQRTSKPQIMPRPTSQSSMVQDYSLFKRDSMLFLSDNEKSEMVPLAGRESAPNEQVNTALNFASKFDLKINNNNDINISNSTSNSISDCASNDSHRANGENSGSNVPNLSRLKNGFNDAQDIKDLLEAIQDASLDPSLAERLALVFKSMQATNSHSVNSVPILDDPLPDLPQFVPKPAALQPSAQVLRPEVNYGTWRMRTGSHSELYTFITKLNELQHQYMYTCVDSRRLIEPSLVVSISVAFNNVRSMYKTHHNTAYVYTDYTVHEWYQHRVEHIKEIVINFCRYTSPDMFVHHFVAFIQEDFPTGHELNVATYNESFHPYFTACMTKFDFVYKSFYYCPIEHKLWDDMTSSEYTQMYRSILPPIAIGTRDAPGLADWLLHAWGPHKDKICNWCGPWSVIKTLKTYADFTAHMTTSFSNLALTSLQSAANNVRLDGVPIIPKSEPTYSSDLTSDPTFATPDKSPNPSPPYTTTPSSTTHTHQYGTPRQHHSVPDMSQNKSTGSTSRTILQTHPNRVLFTEPNDVLSVPSPDSRDDCSDSDMGASMQSSRVSIDTLNKAYFTHLGTLLPNKPSAITATFRGFCANIICFGVCNNPNSCCLDHSAAGRALCIKSLDLLRLGHLQEHSQLPYCTLRSA